MATEITALGAVLFELKSAPGCGAEILQRLKAKNIDLSSAAVYGALKQMEAEGLLSKTVADPSARGGRPRQMFKLTYRGSQRAGVERKALLALLNDKGPSLEAGKFYYSRADQLWCCFRIDEGHLPDGQAAMCIRVDDRRIETFYMNGWYDPQGKREDCLIPVPVPQG